MKMPLDEIVVLDVAGDVARLYSATDVHDADLMRAGFLRSGEDLTRPITDDDDRKNLVRTLIGVDALFSSGRDWSPEEIVELYKEQGFTNQGYRVISWTDPQRYVVSVR